MKLDLTKLTSGKATEVEFNFDLLLDSVDYSNFNVISMDSAKCHAKIIRCDREKLSLFVDYSVDVTFPCDRCLEDVKITIENSFEKGVYLKRLDNLSDDELFIIGSSLEIEDSIVEDLCINMPMQIVCSESCEGLCPTCGTNLNKETCDCTNDKIDPRLEELKKLLK